MEAASPKTICRPSAPALNGRYESLKGIILHRRSVRRFLPDPVPEADILEMLDCARWAPSDTNQQPWRFVVITNTDLIKRIEELCWETIERLQSRAEERNRPDVAKKLRVFGKYAAAFAGAPALILLVGEPYRSRFTEEIFLPIFPAEEMAMIAREESIKSVSLATQNLLLAAHAMGYGAVAMSGPVILAEREVAALAGIEPEHFVVMAVALGLPAIQPAGPGRKPLEQFITWRR